MTAIATYGVTGDPYLDGLLSGKKWAVTNLTFSFPTQSSYYGSGYAAGENLNGFEAFTAQQANAVRAILKNYAAVVNLTFTEKVESATVHAELRFAESNSTGTAWGYYPSTSAVGGDMWFNNSKNYYDAPVRGNYAWLTMLHEIGHSLGLKHPHEVRGVFGAMPTAHDSLEYTVMSYRSYVGASTSTGYTNGSSSYPQTLMMDDIAAIQKLYGANFATNAGDTVYSWNASTGTMMLNGVAQGAPLANKIIMTIWDGGGNDTYSFANYTSGVTVDLAPGAWTTTSAAQLASLGSGKVAIGNIANALQYQGNAASLIENAIGGSGADKLYGNAAANKLTGGAGNDVLDGRAGTDTAVYSGAQTDYSWAQNADASWTVTDLRSGAPTGIDSLRNIEYLQFTDGLIQIEQTPEPVIVEAPVLRPHAKGESYAVKANHKLVVKASKGVLKNDVDPDGDHLSAHLIKGPHKGKLVLKDDGSFIYAPTKNFNGVVKFKYVATDGDDHSRIVATSITVGRVKKKAGGADQAEHIEDDQIPGHNGDHTLVHKPVADSWQFSTIVPQLPAWTPPQLSSQSDMLSALNSVLAKIGPMSDWFSHDGGSLALPDLPKLGYADHWL
jgi:hypothetical protein